MWKKIISLVVFVMGIALVAIGQKNVGPEGLLTQFVGLALLLGLLYIYNKRYK